jgi:hypothetical protein
MRSVKPGWRVRRRMVYPIMENRIGNVIGLFNISFI